MILNAKCRKCRASGEKLFLKGERCFSSQCPFLRRPYKPGMKSSSRKPQSLSEYGRQLLQKQKAKLIYGLGERQLRKYFEEASSKQGSTSELLFQKLEKRLDNIIFRLGWASSRANARQLVSHGHFLINNRRSKTPSTELRIGDIVTIRPESYKKGLFKDEFKEKLKKKEIPSFVSLDLSKMEGKIIENPSVESLKPAFDISLIVEFYSK